MFEQKEAIVRLLRDDDPHTVTLVKTQLAVAGPEAIPGLQDLLTTDDETVTRHVREVIAEIDAKDASRQLSDLCRAF